MKEKRGQRSYFKYSKVQIQRAYVEVLSKPKWVTRKEPHKKKEPVVSRAALKGRCTKRVNFLAKPRNHYRQKKTDHVNIYCASKAALRTKPTQWNIIAAVPKLQALKDTERRFRKKLPQRQREALKAGCQIAKGLFNEQYPIHGERTHSIVCGVPVHIACFKETFTAPKPRYICQLSPKSRKVFLLRMIQRGQPVKKKPPPKLPRGPKKTLKEFEKRLNVLAAPFYHPEEKPIDPYQVSKKALTFKITERIAALAKHRVPRPPPPVYDFRGREIFPPRVWDLTSRQKVTASERTNQLSVPKRVKKKATEDVKEDPFAVSKAALSASASERLIQLSVPIRRD